MVSCAYCAYVLAPASSRGVHPDPLSLVHLSTNFQGAGNCRATSLAKDSGKSAYMHTSYVDFMNLREAATFPIADNIRQRAYTIGSRTGIGRVASETARIVGGTSGLGVVRIFAMLRGGSAVDLRGNNDTSIDSYSQTDISYELSEQRRHRVFAEKCGQEVQLSVAFQRQRQGREAEANVQIGEEVKGNIGET